MEELAGTEGAQLADLGLTGFAWEDHGSDDQDQEEQSDGHIHTQQYVSSKYQGNVNLLFIFFTLVTNSLLVKVITSNKIRDEILEILC